jgi:hypothetical protein
MLYKATLSIPANTPEAAPAEVTAQLNKGVVTEIAVYIPPGHAGMVEARVLRGGSQVWPSTPGETFRGDDAMIRWDDNYKLEDEPLTFTLQGFSPGTTYDHDILFHFEVLDLETAEEAGGLRGMLRHLGELFLGREV